MEEFGARPPGISGQALPDPERPEQRFAPLVTNANDVAIPLRLKLRGDHPKQRRHRCGVFSRFHGFIVARYNRVFSRIVAFGLTVRKLGSRSRRSPRGEFSPAGEADAPRPPRGAAEPLAPPRRRLRPGRFRAHRRGVGDSRQSLPLLCESSCMELDEIRRAEIELLTSAVRRDPARLAELLHPGFVEVGRSGRLWSRDETIAALAHEPGRKTPATSEWALHSVAPGLTLVTYVVSRPEGDSRHSSLWAMHDGRPAG